MDLSACDREPIHTPGAIQPHGVLLVLDPRSEQVVQAAGDAARFLGVESPIGCRFADLIGKPLAAFAEAQVLRAGEEPVFLGTFRPSAGARELDILAHARDGHLLVEFEPSLEDRPSDARMLARLRSAVAQIKAARTATLACEAAAREIRSLTGFDRVMVYHFLDDGSGKVVAEARDGHLAAFLNHHYPAGDVPRQVRALYLRNHVRVIPDAGFEPAPLLPAGGDLIDMSDCVLRSVSPVHSQYMKNMGVAASMSVAVIRGEELWGLIACHHGSAKLAPYELREACRQIAGGLAQRLETIATLEHAEEAQRLASRREALLHKLSESDMIETELGQCLDDLMQLIPCEGVALCYGGKVLAAGATPAKSDCLQLARWVRERSAAPYAANQLSLEYAAAASFVREASGLLAITASHDDPIDLLWLRGEYAETIEWAGHPHKDAELDPDTGRPMPRRSFEIWRETVRGRARSWTGAEIDTARRLRDGIERMRERQRLNRLQSKVIHMSRMSAMGAMASTIAHELNQPLTAARNYMSGSRRLLETRGGEGISEVIEVLDKAADQTLRAGEIVRHLRQLVFEGRSETRPCDLAGIVDDACSMALLDASELGVVWETRLDRPMMVMADHVQIQQVLINLIRNAVDAMADVKERRLCISARRMKGGLVEVAVTDSGPGIAAGARERLFSPFNTTKDNGMGIGLSICRTIVEGHGGQIWAADSETGARLVFTMLAASNDV